MCSKIFGHNSFLNDAFDVLAGSGLAATAVFAPEIVGAIAPELAAGAADAGVAGVADAVGAGVGSAAADTAGALGAGAVGADAAPTGVGAGLADAGAAAAALGAGGLISDAAGGATVSQGVPLISTYGPVSTFATDAAADIGTAATGLADASGGTITAPAAPAAPPPPTVAPGVTTSATPSVASNASALGGPVASSPGPGPAAFAPPSSVAPASLDPTSAASLSGFQANVPAGTASLGTDVTTPGSDIVGNAIGASSGPVPGVAVAPATDATGAAAPVADPFDVPAAPAASSGGPFSSIGNAINNVGTFLSSPTGKLISTGVSGIGLARDLLSASNPNPIPGEAQLASLAQQLGSTGASLVAPNAAAATQVAGQATGQAATLENYLTTGTLPTPVQDALDQATQSAVTNIKAQYAAKGMPPNSSSEQQDIASVEQNAIIQGGTLAAQLYSQGVSLDQLASQIYTGLVGSGTSAAGAGAGALESVVGTNTTINTGVNNAIANLSSALGGGSKAIINGNTVAIPATP